MRQEAEQMFWVSSRGLIVTLPPDASRKIAVSALREEPLPNSEAMRLGVIYADPILKRRYPDTFDGERYMRQVCYERRSQLYGAARSMSDCIVDVARGLGSSRFAVILFGSTAKSLTKAEDNLDPSNIDITLIGDFDKQDREFVLNGVRDTRQNISETIGNNVGVFVQNECALMKDGFNSALNYIASCARALYDPMGVWKRIETEALEHAKTLKRYNAKPNHGKQLLTSLKHFKKRANAPAVEVLT